MLSLVAVALLAQSPTPVEPLAVSPSAPGGCVVALVRTEGMEEGGGAVVASRIVAALNAQGIPQPLSVDAVQGRAGAELKGCAGKPACFAGVARTLGAGAVVTVDAAKIFGELTVELALIDAATGRLLADKVFAGELESASVNAQLEDFARTARYALLTLPAFQRAPAPDAPRVTQLTPKATEPAPDPSGTRPTPVLAWTATGAAAAAGATAAVFGAMSLGTWMRSNVGRSGNLVDVTRPEAQDMTRNSYVAGVAGGVCAALTGAAVYLWLNPPDASR